MLPPEEAFRKIKFMTNVIENNTLTNYSTSCSAIFYTLFTDPTWTPIPCDKQFNLTFFLCESSLSQTTTSLTILAHNQYCSAGYTLVSDICMKFTEFLSDGNIPLTIDSHKLLHNTLSAWSLGDNTRLSVMFPDYSTCLLTNSLSEVRVKEWFASDCSRDVAFVISLHMPASHQIVCNEAQHFKCSNLVCILTTYVCDGTADCKDESDEKGCNDRCYDIKIKDEYQDQGMRCLCSLLYFQCSTGRCIPQSHRCDDIIHCDDLSDEYQCSININDVIKLSTTETTVVKINGTCPLGYSMCNIDDEFCYPDDKWCVYVRDPDASILCPHKEHLYHCEWHTCPAMFKCRLSYCIPTYQVCDHTVDCPSGEDELSCRTLTCPGMLRCRIGGVCVHPTNICDGRFHCVESLDDETLCKVKSCPAGCTCRGRLVSCVALGIEDYGRISDAASGLIIINSTIHSSLKLAILTNLLLLSISNSRFTRDSLNWQILFGLDHLQELFLDNNGLLEIGPDTFNACRRVILFRIKDNSFHTLVADSFTGLRMVRDLDLSYSQIKVIAVCAFCGMHNVSVLNLSNNHLSTIQTDVFAGLLSLYLIDLRNNKFVRIYTPLELKIKFNVYVDKACYCCHLSSLKHCLYINDLSDNAKCTNIIQEHNNPKINLVVSALILCANIIILGYHHSLTISPVHSFLQQQQIVSNSLFEIYVISILLYSSYYKDDFITLTESWRNGKICLVLNTLVIFGLSMSKLTSTLLVTNQLLATKYALILQPFRMKQVIFCDCVVSTIVVLYIICHYLFHAVPGTYLCLTLSLHDFTDLPFFVVTLVFFTLNFIVTIVNIILNINIVQSVKQSAKALDTVDKFRKMHTALAKRTAGRIAIECCSLLLLLNLLLSQSWVNQNGNQEKSAHYESVHNDVALITFHILAVIHTPPYIVNMIHTWCSQYIKRKDKVKK